jgi:hypothetical protein
LLEADDHAVEQRNSDYETFLSVLALPAREKNALVRCRAGFPDSRSIDVVMS